MKGSQTIIKVVIVLFAISQVHWISREKGIGFFQITNSPILKSGWKVKFDGSSSSPIIANGVLYVGSSDGALYAYDPNTGNQMWQAQTGSGQTSGPNVITVPEGTDLSKQIETGISNQRKFNRKKEIQSTPVYNNGTVYVGSEDFSFYAFDARSGEVKWTFPTNGGIDKKAIILDSSVFIVSKDGLLYAIDELSGQKKWDFESFPGAKTWEENHLPPPGHPNQLRIENGSVFVANWIRGEFKTFFSAIRADSGIAKWNLSFEGWDAAEHLVVNGLAFISYETRGKTKGNRYARVVAVDADSGDIKWEFQQAITEHGFKAIDVADNALYFETGTTFHALDMLTGTVLWQFELTPKLSGLLYRKSAYIEDFVYLINDGKLHALDPATGEEKWSFKVGKESHVEKIRGSAIYILDGKSIKALNLKTGDKIWSFNANTFIASKPLFHNDMIYFTTKSLTYFGVERNDQGYLYAISAATSK